jgi:5-methylcytosine-specific restriction endonuclease McrA
MQVRPQSPFGIPYIQTCALELEHKDGNSDNNIEDNLELLCPNCHSQSPTYKAKNVGNGRHYRRQLYAKGKSF